MVIFSVVFNCVLVYNVRTLGGGAGHETWTVSDVQGSAGLI